MDSGGKINAELFVMTRIHQGHFVVWKTPLKLWRKQLLRLIKKPLKGYPIPIGLMAFPNLSL